MINKKTFAIVGGGIGGLTLAVAMYRKGFDVKVYENAPSFKPLGAGIVLAPNALKAFEALGLAKEIMAAGHELKLFRITDSTGAAITTTNAEKFARKFRTFNTYTFHRAELHQALLAQLPAEIVHYGKGVTDFSTVGDNVHLKFHDGTQAEEDFVIAADGIHSVFRRKLLSDNALRHSGYTSWRGIADSIQGLSNVEATEAWGAGKRFGIVPLKNNRVYWYATIESPAENLSLANYSAEELALLFEHFPKPVSDLISSTKTFINGDIADFKPISRFAFGKIVLMGDAAHATTPNLGQGACLAIEDAVVLANCLQGRDAAEAFKAFEDMRIKRTTKVVNASYNLGRIAQMRNPFLIEIRNTAMRWAPASFSERQFKFLYDVRFS